MLHPGDVVGLDSLSSHKARGVIESIESMGAKVYKLQNDVATQATDKLCGLVLDLFTESARRTDIASTKGLSPFFRAS